MGSSPIRVAIPYASVAQLVEQGTENPRVVGSIPTGGTISADLAHLVERHLAKVEVAGSSPVIRSKIKGHSLWVSFCFGAQLTRLPRTKARVSPEARGTLKCRTRSFASQTMADRRHEDGGLRNHAPVRTLVVRFLFFYGSG